MASTEMTAFGGGDLWRRRRPKAARPADGQRTDGPSAPADGRSALVRARRQLQDDKNRNTNRTAVAVALVLAVGALLLVGLAFRLLGGGGRRHEFYA